MGNQMTAKPKAVQEVEASAPTAVQQAWDKLATGEQITEDDMPQLVEAGRAERARWLISQRKKGKEELT